MTVNDLKKQADELAASEVLTATNDGTFGADECHRAVGSGDPKFGVFRVYTRVGDGRERRTGCDEDRAPGYRRDFREELTAKQRELRELRSKIAAVTR